MDLKLPSKDLSLYSYNMVISPEVEKKTPDHDNKPENCKKFPKGEKRRQLIKIFLDDPVFKAKGSAPIATDFNVTLITKSALNLGKGKFEDQEGKFTVDYGTEGFTSASAEKYTIRVKLTAMLGISDFNHYLNPNMVNSDYNKSPIQEALNIILGYYTKRSDKVTRVGGRKIFPFSPALAEDKLDNGLVALRGYFNGAIAATSRILVNVNIAHGAFYDGIPLKELIKEYRRQGTRGFELHRFLKRLRVKTTHLSASDKAFEKIRTISGLATKNDGANLLRPPSIDTKEPIGGGPHQVSFYEDPSTIFSIRSSTLQFERSAEASGPRQISELPQEEQDRYITVSAFFKKGKAVSDMGSRNAVDGL